jgi:thioredoxin 1
MSDIKKLDDSNFENFIKENKIVIVDFWAEWCGPCQMFAAIFEDFAKDETGVVCAKVNIDQAQKIAEKYNVLSIPTTIVFKDGVVVEQQTGAVPKTFLQKLVEKHK